CSIVEFDQPIAFVDRLAGDLPDGVGAEYTLDRRGASLRRLEQVDRLRMTQRNARILPDHMCAKRLTRVDIGVNDSVAVYEQQGERELLHQIANSVAAQAEIVTGGA